MEEYQLTPEEQWQKDEKDRLEYEGYCKKIKKAIEEDIDKSSQERALWELVQNARDMSTEARIKIELLEDCLAFTHHGKPFDYTSFRSLVKQDSSKDHTNSDLAGQYGTGFMTTHIFNRFVHVSGPYAVKKGKDLISGYIQIQDFPLDRTQVGTAMGPSIMKKQLEKVDEFCKIEPRYSEIKDDATSFRYDLTAEQVCEISDQLSNFKRLLPFVLAINEKIKDVEIIDEHSMTHVSLQKSNKKSIIDCGIDNWSEWDETVYITDHKCPDPEKRSSPYHLKSLRSDIGDVIIIPPFPALGDSAESLPSLFLWFPLLGTEAFGVNFIFHSKRFHPVEMRNNIMLPGSSQAKQELGGKNRDILIEMMNVLFAYYSRPENAHQLTMPFCKVKFPTISEDEETLRFFNEMHNLWKKEIPSWEVIPVGNDYYSIQNPRVKVLHPAFYGQLTPNSKKKYEKVLSQYALLPKYSGEESYLMPQTDLIAWSEIVNDWDVADNSFFISLADVCNAIKSKTDDLHSFLQLMIESENESVMEEYPLLPNRNGALCLKSSLRYGSFMTNDVYNLVNVVMGDEASKMLDPSFYDVCKVDEYTKEDLQKAITFTITRWRTSSLTGPSPTPLTNNQLNALIGFCSASCQIDFNNRRSKLLPLLAKYYNKEYKKVDTIRFLPAERDEEEFYSTALNFLLDYTLSQVCKKDSAWVIANKDWLHSFLFAYDPKTNNEREKRLDIYGVLPNQCGVLCKKQDVKKNAGVPTEMVVFYKAVLNKDLLEGWVDKDFEDIVALNEDTPDSIASAIESSLVADMRQDSDKRSFSKVVRDIILLIGDHEEWKEWFKLINEKKEQYTFSMKSGKAQKSLFSLMGVEDPDLERLAELNDAGCLNDYLDRIDDIRKREIERERQFRYLYTIGKHIEDILRNEVSTELTCEPNELETDDQQNGQDMVVRYKGQIVYYLECKAKWSFDDPAHMSSQQMKQAVRNENRFALICVDCTRDTGAHVPVDATKEQVAEAREEILLHTSVHTDIGGLLSPTIGPQVEHEDDVTIDEKQKVRVYSALTCNIPKVIFNSGVPFSKFIEGLKASIRNHLFTAE